MSTLEITSTYLMIENGVFDSRRRHVRLVTNTNQTAFWLTEGPTIDIRILDDQVFWRYEVGPRSITMFSPFTNNAYAPLAGFAVDRAGAF